MGNVTRADKPTERVEAREIEWVEERERGMKPGETESIEKPEEREEPRVELEGEC